MSHFEKQKNLKISQLKNNKNLHLNFKFKIRQKLKKLKLKKVLITLKGSEKSLKIRNRIKIFQQKFQKVVKIDLFVIYFKYPCHNYEKILKISFFFRKCRKCHNFKKSLKCHNSEKSLNVTILKNL